MKNEICIWPTGWKWMASISRHTQGNGKAKKTVHDLLWVSYNVRSELHWVIQRVQTGPGPTLSYGICPETLHVLCCPFKIKVCLDLTMRGRKSCLAGRWSGGGGWGYGHLCVTNRSVIRRCFVWKFSCITSHSLIHAYMYINNACNLISVHQ